MPSTILEIATEAADELDLQRPVSLFGSNLEEAPDNVKLLRALTRTCRFLRDHDGDFQELRARHTITVTADPPAGGPTEAIDGAFPTAPNLHKRIIKQTIWNKSTNAQMMSYKAKAWSAVQSRQINPFDRMYTIEGDYLLMYPRPAVGTEIIYTYIRDAVGKNNAGAFIQKFAADDDTPLFDDELILLGVIAHFRQMERYDYAIDMGAFTAKVNEHRGHDGEGQVFDMGQVESEGFNDLEAMKTSIIRVATP